MTEAETPISIPPTATENQASVAASKAKLDSNTVGNKKETKRQRLTREVEERLTTWPDLIDANPLVRQKLGSPAQSEFRGTLPKDHPLRGKYIEVRKDTSTHSIDNYELKLRGEIPLTKGLQLYGIDAGINKTNIQGQQDVMIHLFGIKPLGQKQGIGAETTIHFQKIEGLAPTCSSTNLMIGEDIVIDALRIVDRSLSTNNSSPEPQSHAQPEPTQ